MTVQELQGLDPRKLWTDKYIQNMWKLRVYQGKPMTKPPFPRGRMGKFLEGCASVLDVGCGWMPYQTDKRHTGLDVSPAMLRIARRLHPEIKLVHGNIFDLRFTDGQFEGVRSTGLLRHIKESDVALREMMRVCSQKLAFSHLVAVKGTMARKYRSDNWCVNLQDVLDLLDCKVETVKLWARNRVKSVLFLCELE